MYCPGADMTLISMSIGAEPKAVSYMPTEHVEVSAMPMQAHLDSTLLDCRFLATSSARTYDPSEAKLFFIPAFLARLFFNEIYSEDAAAVTISQGGAHKSLGQCSQDHDSSGILWLQYIIRILGRPQWPAHTQAWS